MKEIELLKIIFKDSPDILEPLNKIDKEIERLNNNNQAMQEEMARTWKKYDELQDRIEKAKEYIELGINFDSLGVSRTKRKLLEILKGSNKE